MLNIPRKYRLTLLFIVSLFATTFNGCTVVKPFVMLDASVNIYWPPSPDPPRIRYLLSINGPEDIVPEKSKMQKITEILTGDNRVLIDLLTPSAVTISEDNILYIADTFAGIIHRYDLGTREVSYVTSAGDEQLVSPVALALDREQNLYISDSVNSKVYKLSKNGYLLGTIAPAEGFKRPAGIAITASGEKLIVDAVANKLHKFSDNDLHLGEFTKNVMGDELNTPSFVSVDRAGNVYLTDAMNFVVRLYDKDGNFLRRIGEVGDVPGTFARPKGIAVDSDRNIYVVDATHDNVQIFNKDGQLLLYFGSSGADPGQFYLPSGIFIDSQDRIFIADTFNRRVQVFQYLKTGGRNE